MTNWHHFSGIFGELDSLKTATQTLYINGNIYIDSKIKVSNLLIEGDIVKDYNVKQDDFRDAKIIDLNGKTIFPGFMDTHAHLLETGFVLNVGVNLRGISNSTQEIAQKLKEKVANSNQNETILAVGFWMDDYNKWSLEDLAIIDTVTPNNSVMAVDMSGHNLFLNSVGMKLCNITDDTFHDNMGGISVRENGKLTGMFREKSMQKPADEIFSKFGHEELAKEGARKIIDFWASKGYTGMVDLMGAPGFRLHKPDIFYALEQEDKLNMRINFCYTLFDVNGVDEAAKFAGKDTDLVRFYGGKIFVDGAFASGEPWTTWEHTNGGFGSKLINIDDSEGEQYNINRIVLRAEELGLNMHYHTQGDMAIQAVLNALEYTKNKLGDIKKTHTLAHVAFPTQTQMQQIASYNCKVTVTVQPAFCQIEDDLTQYYAGHTQEAYPIKQMFDAGIIVGMSTDFSVSPVDMTTPSTIMAIAMKGANKPDVYLPLSAEEVVRGFSENNAIVSATLDTGSLHKGKKADFVIYDKNFYDLDINEIKENSPKVIETWVGGKRRF
ncbi:MAG: hypothetical protein RL154_679 [Pseudomonadota bacterium]|jgi:predicted amidohydrolase YtcJ